MLSENLLYSRQHLSRRKNIGIGKNHIDFIFLGDFGSKMSYSISGAPTFSFSEYQD